MKMSRMKMPRMKMLRQLPIIFCLSIFFINAEQCKQIHPEVMHTLENVIDEIYHLNTQEVQEIVCQDFGCIPEVTAEQLHATMQANKDLVVINVLSEKWYHDCHIEGSINVPLDKLIYQMQDWDRDTDIVVYCALDACDAGEKAYVLLRCMGFEHVVDYHGGIKEWFGLGYPTVGPCVSEYLHDDCTRCPQIFLFDFDFKSMLKETRYIKRFRNRCISI